MTLSTGPAQENSPGLLSALEWALRLNERLGMGSDLYMAWGWTKDLCGLVLNDDIY